MLLTVIVGIFRIIKSKQRRGNVEKKFLVCSRIHRGWRERLSSEFMCRQLSAKIIIISSIGLCGKWLNDCERSDGRSVGVFLRLGNGRRNDSWARTCCAIYNSLRSLFALIKRSNLRKINRVSRNVFMGRRGALGNILMSDNWVFKWLKN